MPMHTPSHVQSVVWGANRPPAPNLIYMCLHDMYMHMHVCKYIKIHMHASV